MDKSVRGNSLISMVKYVEQLDDSRKAQVQRAMSSDLIALIPDLKPDVFYPMEVTNAMHRAIASPYPDPQAAYDNAIQVGRFIADEAINTFLRLLVKFLSPTLFARKFGDFFRKDHTFGTVETDLAEIDQHRFVLHMSDVGGYLYIAPASMGWMLHTLETMGCKNVRARETSSPPPAPQDVDRYRFEVSWE